MEISTYQSIKLCLLEIFNLSKDAIHIHIGIGVFFIASIVWTKGRIKTLCLLPVFCVALLMEVLDFRDDLNSFGYPRWSASIHDFVNTVFWPTVFVLLNRLNKLR